MSIATLNPKQIALQFLAVSVLLSGCNSVDEVPVTTEQALIHPPAPTWNDFPTRSLTENEQLRLKHFILFDFDSDTVSANSYNNIKAHALFIQAHPKVRVLVEGHADKQGSFPYNYDLALRRAKSVARVMRQHGVKESQIIIRSYGTSKPMSHNNNKDGSLNRRVAIFY